MLSYKEYKLLNESLYGAFNLGLRNPATVGGIISGSSVNGTEAALEAESEAALEESKKKKKMDCGDEEEEEEEDMEDKEEKDSEEEEGDDSEEGDEDEEESEEDDEDEEEEEPKFMKKKAKKEWSEVVSDLEALLEEIEDETTAQEMRKGLDLIKEGAKKSKKGCGSDCKCEKCKGKKKKHPLDVNYDGKVDGEDFESMRKKKKKDGEGDKEGKKCGKNMNEDEKKWWDSVNGMMNSDPNQKHWSGWSEVGEVQQAVRENTDINEISSGLLDRAADSAMSNANGPRAGRLADKFSAGADARRKQEFGASEKINMTIDNNGNEEVYSMMIQGVEPRGAVARVKGLMKRDGSTLSPSLVYLDVSNSGQISFASVAYQSLDIVSLDRRSAMVLANAVNSYMGDGFIRPTNLPLA
jgi:flagellar biosynthesis GTPase FlhF